VLYVHTCHTRVNSLRNPFFFFFFFFFFQIGATPCVAAAFNNRCGALQILIDANADVNKFAVCACVLFSELCVVLCVCVVCCVLYVSRFVL